MTEQQYFDAILKHGNARPARDEWGGVWADVRGRVRLADGTELPAVLQLCVSDSCEHWGTTVRLPDGSWADQQDDDFLARLGRTKEQVFPYAYTYDRIPDAHDHHLMENGWSR